jgi:hypothetical protein
MNSCNPFTEIVVRSRARGMCQKEALVKSQLCQLSALKNLDFRSTLSAGRCTGDFFVPYFVSARDVISSVVTRNQLGADA